MQTKKNNLGRRTLQGGTWKNRLTSLKNLLPMFELIWASGRATIVASISLRAFLAILPLAALWIGKQIIDLVVRGAKAPGSHSQVIRLLIAECAIATLGAILSRAISPTSFHAKSACV
jgi:ATP-binding cassette subfamily B protein